MKFGEFVQWPQEAFAAPDSTLNICVVGDSNFAAIVAATVKNESVAGRKVVAHALARITPSDLCHVAYFAGSAQQSVKDGLTIVQGRPALTVTDEARGTAAGAIHFVLLSNRVRFAIDDHAAGANGLTLSSALLNIAVSVKRREN